MSTVTNILVIVLSLMVGLCFMTFIFFYSKSHRLRVRVPTNKGSMIEADYWVVKRTDKRDKSEWLVSVPWQPKFKIELPPKEVIDIGKKGRMFAEVYRLSNDEFIWIKDKGLDETTIIERRKVKDKDGNETIKEIKASEYQPFTVTQRAVVVNQSNKADKERRAKVTFLQQNAPWLILVGALLIVIVLHLVYWGDIAKATIDVKSADSSSVKDMIQDLYQGGKGVAQEFKPEQNNGISYEGSNPPPR